MQRKHRKLTEFTKKQTESKATTSSEEYKASRDKTSPQQESTSELSFEEIVKLIQERTYNTTQRPRQEKTIEANIPEKEKKPGVVEKTGPSTEAGVVDKVIQVAKKAFTELSIRVIECDKTGVCKDQKRLGEVYEDQIGLKWQRTFVNTTRMPIFLDFIAEKAEIKGKIGKAFIVATARGAKAIIPNSFICEAVTRYGVLLDIDKCTNYKPSPWAEKSRRSKSEK